MTTLLANSTNIYENIQEQHLEIIGAKSLIIPTGKKHPSCPKEGSIYWNTEELCIYILWL